MSNQWSKPISNLPYPNAYHIEEMFANRSNPCGFNAYFSDSVDVIVVGQDFHLGGRYNPYKPFATVSSSAPSRDSKIGHIRLRLCVLLEAVNRLGTVLRAPLFSLIQ